MDAKTDREALTGYSPASAIAARNPPPVVFWAVAGAAILLFQLYVLARWVSGPHFVHVLPGPDPVSHGQHLSWTALQIAVPTIALFCLVNWVILPWRRQGQMTATGRLFAAGSMIFFWDLVMNYSSTVLFYNSNFVNFGAWSLGSWPGWTSPNGFLLPEPIFVSVPGYVALVTTQAVFICWAMRKAKRAWPRVSAFSWLMLILIACFALDTVVETGLLRMGIYAYPGAIRSISLFAGHTYQLPMNEAVLFGGLGIGSMCALLFFQDSQGRTFAEAGVDEVRLGSSTKQWLRGFAVFGFCHVMFFALYAVPMQWFSLHGDAFPPGYPSYLTNHMLVYGVNANQSPGPGVMSPNLGTN